MAEQKDIPIAFVTPLVAAIQQEIDPKEETRRLKRGERCPYGDPGRRLWVRESFVALRWDGKMLSPSKICDANVCIFRDGSVGGTVVESIYWHGWKVPDKLWRPPMHLPYRFARLFLEVVEIRSERVQDITEEGAVAEGFRAHSFRDGRGTESARHQCAVKWDEINGLRKAGDGNPSTWANNPEVWVVKFKRIK